MKLKELQYFLREKKLDGCILDSKDPNFGYYLQDFVDFGMLFIPKKGTPTVFIHPYENLSHSFQVVKMEKKFIPKAFFKKKLSIGYNAGFTNVKQYSKLKNIFRLNDIEKTLESIRMVKTEKEIQYLKKAAKIADDILKDLIKNLRKHKFTAEKEIKDFLKLEMAKRSVVQSFEPIIASEKGAASPHYFGEKKLKKGFLLIDMGVKYKGYCSDITRTFYLGKPSKEEKEIYETVLHVQKSSIRMCKKGVSCSSVYEYSKRALGDKLCHGLGHGIGLKIHESPNLKPGFPDIFENNMAFTVEPGWYDLRKKIGIRIEDDVIIKNGKPFVLTKTTKDLICF